MPLPERKNSPLKKVLFIHHGGVAGGAPLSMLYTMQGLRSAGYDPLAALVKPSAALHALYNEQGFETLETPWIPIFITWSGSEGKRWNPIMWKGVFDAWVGWKRAQKKLALLLREEKIDIVHLNSVALSNPAGLLMEIDFPFVWHVREHGPVHQGRRFKFLSERLRRAPNVIFLSRAEQHSWLGDAVRGRVVHNFVDFKKFDHTISPAAARELLGIGPGKKVMLYVGGKKKHKGIFELLATLGQLKKTRGDDFVCLMPDSAIGSPPRSKLEKRMLKIIEEKKLEKVCLLYPFRPDIVEMFAACDVLVFPATKPHFARPVIEASAMGKPVIASNLQAIDELVIPGETGYLIDPHDQEEFARKVAEIFDDGELRSSMGAAGLKFARANFDHAEQMKKIEEMYASIHVASR